MTFSISFLLAKIHNVFNNLFYRSRNGLHFFALANFSSKNHILLGLIFDYIKQLDFFS